MTIEATKFWDAYQDGGIAAAMASIDSDGEPSVDDLRGAVPALIETAKERSIDMLVFLKELDALEASHATGTDNDGSELSVDGSVDADPVEDADDGAVEQAADVEAEDGTQETEGSAGV